MKSGPFKESRKKGLYSLKRVVSEQEILDMAKHLAESKLSKGEILNSPSLVKDHLTILLQEYEYEVFGVIFLDTQHQMLSFSLLFRGTIDNASIYPREVVKEALAINAAAVIFVHNHPSGITEPSQADHRITKRLIEALQTVDIRVLDHFIVGSGKIVSFAEKGFL